MACHHLFITRKYPNAGRNMRNQNNSIPLCSKAELQISTNAADAANLRKQKFGSRTEVTFQDPLTMTHVQWNVNNKRGTSRMHADDILALRSGLAQTELTTPVQSNTLIGTWLEACEWREAF